MATFPNSFPGAIWMPVPGADVFSANSHKAIVIHKTASPNWSTAQAVAQGFINEAIGPSVHYIVGRDGVVVQCVSEVSGAGGNCCLETGHDTFWNQFGGVNLNTVTLSIEHVDTDPENQTPCTQAQISASFNLVLYLAQKWGIPSTSIKPHSSLDPISRANCPGNYPFQQLVDFVAQGGNAAPATPPTPNPNFDSEALDCWESFLNDIGKITVPSNTAIFAEWKRAWQTRNIQFGPPITLEYGSSDGQGNKITCQQFAGGRAEHYSATQETNWYTAQGLVKF